MSNVIDYEALEKVDVLKEYDGTDTQRLQAAFDEHAGVSMRKIWLRKQNWFLDAPITVNGGETNIYGHSDQFSTSRISSLGDFSAFIFSGGTRVNIWNLMFFSASEGGSYFGPNHPMLSFTNCHFVRMWRCHLNGSRDFVRRGLFITGCDSFYMQFVRMVNWGMDSILVETGSAGEVVASICNFEAFNSRYGWLLLRGKVHLLDCQLERTGTVLLGRRPVLDVVRSNAQARVIVTNEAVEATILGFDAQPSGALILDHPFVNLGPIAAQNANFYDLKSLRGASVGKESVSRSVMVEPNADYLVGALVYQNETANTAQLAVYERDAANAQGAYLDWSDEITTPAGQDLPGHRPHTARSLFVRTGPTAEHLLSTSFNNLELVASRSLVTGGGFLTAAGDFDASAWEAVGCSVAQAAPWHTSQNLLVPGLTADGTLGATTVTISGGDASVLIRRGVFYYDGATWIRVTGVAAGSVTLASGLTLAQVGSVVRIAWPWASITQNTPGTDYSIRQLLPLVPGKTYRGLVRAAQGNAFFCVGDARRGDNNKRWEFSGLSIGSTMPERALADGSHHTSLLFRYIANDMGRYISIGSTDDQSAPVLVQFVAVVEVD